MRTLCKEPVQCRTNKGGCVGAVYREVIRWTMQTDAIADVTSGTFRPWITLRPYLHNTWLHGEAGGAAVMMLGPDLTHSKTKRAVEGGRAG